MASPDRSRQWSRINSYTFSRATSVAPIIRTIPWHAVVASLRIADLDDGPRRLEIYQLRNARACLSACLHAADQTHRDLGAVEFREMVDFPGNRGEGSPVSPAPRHTHFPALSGRVHLRATDMPRQKCAGLWPGVLVGISPCSPRPSLQKISLATRGSTSTGLAPASLSEPRPSLVAVLAPLRDNALVAAVLRLDAAGLFAWPAVLGSPGYRWNCWSGCPAASSGPCRSTSGATARA